MVTKMTKDVNTDTLDNERVGSNPTKYINNLNIIVEFSIPSSKLLWLSRRRSLAFSSFLKHH